MRHAGSRLTGFRFMMANYVIRPVKLSTLDPYKLVLRHAHSPFYVSADPLLLTLQRPVRKWKHNSSGSSSEGRGKEREREKREGKIERVRREIGKERVRAEVLCGLAHLDCFDL